MILEHPRNGGPTFINHLGVRFQAPLQCSPSHFVFHHLEASGEGVTPKDNLDTILLYHICVVGQLKSDVQSTTVLPSHTYARVACACQSCQLAYLKLPVGRLSWLGIYPRYGQLCAVIPGVRHRRIQLAGAFVTRSACFFGEDYSKISSCRCLTSSPKEYQQQY